MDVAGVPRRVVVEPNACRIVLYASHSSSSSESRELYLSVSKAGLTKYPLLLSDAPREVARSRRCRPAQLGRICGFCESLEAWLCMKLARDQLVIQGYLVWSESTGIPRVSHAVRFASVLTSTAQRGPLDGLAPRVQQLVILCIQPQTMH